MERKYYVIVDLRISEERNPHVIEMKLRPITGISKELSTRNTDNINIYLQM